VKHPIKNSNNKRNKEGIHLKNLAKQLELYKQNPATGGNGGGMGACLSLPRAGPSLTNGASDLRSSFSKARKQVCREYIALSKTLRGSKMKPIIRWSESKSPAQKLLYL
ncbi:hypothetical protein DBR06_SOUSAS1010156, partial [Sousa chinensis]